MKKYYPVLLSKAGEIVALKNLTQDVKDEIVPIIQVLNDGFDRVEQFGYSDWNFDQNDLFLDFSLCDFDSKKIENLLRNLLHEGVNLTPVVQSNSNTEYFALLRRLISNNLISNGCIRFSNSNLNLANLNSRIASLLSSLGINRNQTSILLDFGFVENQNYNRISQLCINTISSINNKADFSEIIVASGSFIPNLGPLVPPGRLYQLHRYEWDIWQTLLMHPGFHSILRYSDYGPKYPYYTVSNYQGSCSIKYTCPNEFIIYRGEISSNHREGNGQYIIFADQLIRSTYFSGPGFSWGDSRINFYAGQSLEDPKRQTGNSTSWVEISQNHHITLLHSIL